MPFRTFACIVAVVLALLAAAWRYLPPAAGPTGEARFERLEKSSDVELLDAAAGTDPALRACAFYHLALRAHRKGDRRLAEEFLGQSVKAEVAGVYSALSAYELGKIHEAAWRARPDGEPERLEKALALYRGYLKIHKGHAKTPHALHRAALLHIGRGEHALAAECFEALFADWKEFPDLPNAALAYAGSLTLDGKFDACISFLGARLAAWKDDAAFRARALLAMGFAREMAGRRAEARADYERIVRDCAASPEAELARNTLAKWR